jgi:hypothetical protein
MSRVHVVLVPGFFGFANLGDLAYFGHVHAYLGTTYAARGWEPVLHVVRTPPTASLPKRAARVVEVIASEAADDAPIHLVGHSSGGLDCRLLLAPGVVLPTPHDVEPIAARVTGLVSVSAPHRGTPAAAFFTSRMGGQLLDLLSLGTMHALRLGRSPLKLLLALGTAYARLDDFAFNSRLLDQLFRDLLEDFTPERRETITRFLREMRDDHGLLTQLTPEAMETFNATTRERPGVRVGSVATRATPPRLETWFGAGFDPTAHLLHVIYRALHAVAADPATRLPALAPAAVATLRAAYGSLPDPTDSDGVVPTLSQVHGELLLATIGDHLDVIGHYGDAATDPPHVDWLVTGSGFDQARFETVWTTVVEYLTGARPASGARSAESPP